MARNTYKTNSPKNQKPDRKIALNMGFLKDRRFHLAVGFFLLIGSLFLVTSFFSYLFPNAADQSVVESIGKIGLKDSGLETQNWLGLFGAVTSHYFIYQWFGIAAFLIPPLLFLIGYRIVFRKKIIALSKAFVFSLFFLFWISILLGYMVLIGEEPTSMSFYSGSIGYEFAVLIDSLMGWGTYLLLVFLLLV